MEKIDLLRHHGLFDAKVPRYTSYPPANHFRDGLGHRWQADWLKAVPAASDVSIYIHIPFCKRLCWFCACRTQGTKSLRPVVAYADSLLKELESVRRMLKPSIRMSRLHLGGGTPTILPAETMNLLLSGVFAAFPTTDDFEFSVEIDPNEASDDVLQALFDHGMTRASIGVQDFSSTVQKAIGRSQSPELTRAVIDTLREAGVGGLNLDVLYGLPHQTQESFAETLRTVAAFEPDRLAIYGYAHVPWMSKRQVMIQKHDLPEAMARYALSETARTILTRRGYEAIGIDHFALPSDEMTKFARAGTLRRNFQGYTDDQSPTLVGLGASAISMFSHGYSQNAVATSAYQSRVEGDGMAGHRGYRLSRKDRLVAAMIEGLMCRFAIQERDLRERFPDLTDTIRATVVSLMARFPDVFFICRGGLEMHEDARPLVRIVASHVDRFACAKVAHSAAI